MSFWGGKAMITVETDRLVDDYVRRLEAAAAHLPRSHRAELVAEIRAHIDAALLEEERVDETAVRNVLERLGPPDEIVGAAAPPAGEESTAGGAGPLEIAALVAMVVPLFGWMFGMIFVLVSRAWSSRDKVIGVALALIPPLVPIVLLIAASGEGGTQGPVSGGASSPGPGEPSDEGGLGPLEAGALVLGFLAGLPSAAYLGWRLRRPGAPGHAGSHSRR
jgi:hypothetical protein